MKDKSGKNVIQGDIYWINFDPSVGSEIQKKRPAVVIQDQELLEYNQTILVCPIISFAHIHPLDIELNIKSLKKNSRARVTQIKSADITRFEEFIDNIGEEKLNKILDQIDLVLGR